MFLFYSAISFELKQEITFVQSEFRRFVILFSSLLNTYLSESNRTSSIEIRKHNLNGHVETRQYISDSLFFSRGLFWRVCKKLNISPHLELIKRILSTNVNSQTWSYETFRGEKWSEEIGSTTELIQENGLVQCRMQKWAWIWKALVRLLFVTSYYNQHKK